MEASLQFEELVPEMEIEDWWGEPGKVVECSDPHNVYVIFDNGSSCLYCMAGDCEERDWTPIYKRINYNV